MFIENAADIKKILKLDAARWAVTNIRTDALVCDKEFLTLIDSDANGKIRTDEVKSAAAWLISCLNDLSGVDAESDTLNLNAINTENPEGASIHAAVKDALINLGLDNADKITFTQISDHEKIVANALRNGDGVIPPAPLGDSPEAECVKRIMASGRTHKDVNGSDGINADDLDGFEKLSRTYCAWHDELTDNYSTIMPYAKNTPAVYAAVKAVETQFDDFFRALETIRYSAGAPVNLQSTVNTFDPRDPASVKAFLEKSLVSDVSAGREAISATDNLNPVYAAQVKTFFKVISNAAGQEKKSLNADEWREIKTILAP